MTQASRYWIALGFMLTLSAVLAGINLNDDWRTSFRDRFLPDQREILAKAVGDLVGGGRSFSVLKIRDRSSMSIEVFENNEATHQTLFRSRTILAERRDSFFNYKGSAVNLLLLDVNSDGAMEVLTAGFDENLVARMHVFKFNDVTSTLETLGPDSVKF